MASLNRDVCAIASIIAQAGILPVRPANCNFCKSLTKFAVPDDYDYRFEYIGHRQYAWHKVPYVFLCEGCFSDYINRAWFTEKYADFYWILDRTKTPQILDLIQRNLMSLDQVSQLVAEGCEILEHN